MGERGIKAFLAPRSVSDDLADARDGFGASGVLVDLDQGSADLHRASCDRKLHGQAVDESLDDRAGLAAKNRVNRAAHAGIAQEGRALRQDAFVGGLHMGVRADDGRNRAVKIPAERDFLARRLAMHIDKNNRRFLAQARRAGPGG